MLYYITQSLLSILSGKTYYLLFWIYSIAFYDYNFFHATSGFCNFAYLFNLVLLHIYYYITPIYREIFLQFLQYYINRTPFHFRHCAEAVLRHPACLSKTFRTTKGFITSIWAVPDEKVLARLSTAQPLK